MMGLLLFYPGLQGASDWGDSLYNAAKNRQWLADRGLFQNLVARINYAPYQLFGKFPAFVWHQGESDVGTPNHKYILQTFIASVREHTGILDCPFVLGKSARNYVTQHVALSSNNLHSNQVDFIYFSAADRRVLGKR